MSNQNRKKLNPIGNPNYYITRFGNDSIEVAFKYRKKLPNGTNQENFSELNVINFVVNSYKESCFCLAEKIIKSKSKNKEDFVNLYLPLHFCFRHYLELKLKILYLDYAKEEFACSHKLMDLKKELENNCNYNASVFDEPINYISNLENGYPEHFRYLVTTGFQFTDQVTIPIDIGEKIVRFINRIETSSTITRLNYLSTNK